MKFVFALPGYYLGGVTTFCRNLSLGLRQRSHKTVLLVLPIAGQDHPVPEGQFDQAVVIPRGVSTIRTYVAKVAQVIDGLNADILTLNYSPYASASLPYVRRDIIRIPILHSLDPTEIQVGFANRAWSDRIVAVSESVAQSVKEVRPGRRLALCPIGVPLPHIPPQQRQAVRGQPIRLVSAGRIVVPYKRMDRVPPIAKMLEYENVDYHWTVLGDGTYTHKLRRVLSHNGLAHRFDFRGCVSHSTVANVFRNSDVFIMMSDSEGLPQALLEAMAQGVVPVVSRIRGSTTCVVEQRRSGYLCDPSDTAEFVHAVAELANDPLLRSEMAARAADAIARRFSLDAFTDRFLGIIEEVRSGGILRPEPLSPEQMRRGETFRCTGFWRSLRGQTLGQMKRWLLARIHKPLTPEEAELRPSI